MKKMEPWLPDHLEPIEDGADFLLKCKEMELKAEEKIFRKIFFEEVDLSAVIYSKIKFEHCSFYDCHFDRSEFKDVIFMSCNFSNCNFSDSFFERVQFLTSKGVGAVFIGTIMKYVVMKEGNFEYANFDSSRLERVCFEDMELSHANIAQCQCKEVGWLRSKLSEVSFFKTSLSGMDFTSNEIHNLFFSDDNTELKGLIVDIYQAAELAKVLGIKIKSI